MVDQWTGYNAITDNDDGVHPNNTGYQKMADRFFPVVAQALNASSPAWRSAWR